MKRLIQKITLYILLNLLVVTPAFGATSENSQHRLEIIPEQQKQQASYFPIFLQNQKSESLIISADVIDFGPLNATTEVKRKLEVNNSINTNLYLFEDHTLSSADNQIPDTSCDEGTCTETIPSPWLNPLTFGFGYSFDGENYFKVANTSNKKTPTIIKQNSLLLKLNVSQGQKKGLYTNQLTILQIPEL